MIRNYFKIALRNFWRNRLIALLNILGLTTGITAFLFIFQWVNFELSFDDFHQNSDRIYRVFNTFKSESESFSQAPCGPALGYHLPDELAEIESAVRIGGESTKVTVGDNTFFEDNIVETDPNFFRFFGFTLLQGDPDQVLTDPKNIVLTERIAKKYFGEENPMGKIMRLNNQIDMVVTGIVADAPKNSQFNYDMLIPVDYLSLKFNWNGYNDQWIGGWMWTYIKLAPGVEADVAEKKINETVKRFSGSLQDTLNVAYTYSLQPLRDIHLHSDLRYDTPNGNITHVIVFSAIGLIVLIIACINYMNMATASSLRRAKEVGLRKVVGAGRAQLVTQHLVESLVISFTSVFLSVGLFDLMMPFFELIAGVRLELVWNQELILVLVTLGLLTGILSGIYPAMVISSFRPATILKGNFRSATSGVWLRKALVVFQFAVSVTLIAAIFIVNDQLSFIQSKDLGFNKDAVVIIDFQSDQLVRDNFEVFRNELLQHSEIKNVSAHRNSNLGAGLGNDITTTEDSQGKEISTSLYLMSVDANYLDTYGMKLVAGRFFTDQSADSSAVIVNEAAIRTFGWGEPREALGKRFGKGHWATYVVGVVKDFHFENLKKSVDAVLVRREKGRYNLISVALQPAGIKDGLTHLETAWKKVMQDTPLEYSFLDQQIARRYGSEQKFKSIFTIFSSIAMVIACLGLFGLTLFMVENRKKEMGVRKVLGASISNLIYQASVDFLKLVLIAILIGIPIIWVTMNQWLSGFAYRVNVSPVLIILAGAITISVALITLLYQSIRGAMVNPVDVLRNE